MERTKSLMCLMNQKRHHVGHRIAPNTFWSAMRDIRVAKGLTQEQLAERVREGADAPWISRVESGKKDISLRTAIRVAGALNVDMFLDRHKLHNDY
jgi:DNA-binding XRE family transcriptional regulator